MTGICTECFSPDYHGARRRFRTAAKAAGGDLDEILYPVSGPTGEQLFVDVARFGADNPERMLVILSGTHGVEGFSGSGVQVALLKRGDIAAAATSIGILMIHGVNPYGFAWCRRTTHENIDLNRNWIDFGQQLPCNPGYAALHASLCPAEWSVATRIAGQEAIEAYERAHGALAARNALGAGQYTHADGLYFGGHSPAWARETQTAIFAEHLNSARHVGILDLHTGLGPWGFCEPIVTLPSQHPAALRAIGWFGLHVRSTADGSSVGAMIGGDGLSASLGLLPHAQVTPIALEFGTMPRRFVIDANRADNWLHHHGEPAASYATPIMQAVRTAYHSDDLEWQGMVVGQALTAFQQARAGLQQETA